MPPRRPSDRLFRSRLNDLINLQGEEWVARKQGVTVQTVRRWERGDSTPSAARAESVSRTALYRTEAPIIRGRDEEGRFDSDSDIVATPAVRTVRNLQERDEERRQRRIEQARTERQREVARMEAEQPMTREEIYDIARMREKLEENPDGFYEGDEWIDFEIWRPKYDAMYG